MEDYNFIDLAKKHDLDGQKNKFIIEGYPELEASTVVIAREALTNGIDVDVLEEKKSILCLKKGNKKEIDLQNNKKTLSYIGLAFVVIIWGLSPQLTLELYKYYSPTFRLAFAELVLVSTYLIISGKNIHKLNRDYLKYGIITGFFLALANITQKIGLLYTTPAKYAFLENLSCITVPLLMYFFVRKKPSIITYISCITCLVGVFVLNGISLKDGWGIGEVLCGISGLLYGFNIAGTAAFAKKLYVPLYLAVQSVVGCIVSLAFSIYLNAFNIEPIVFSIKLEHLLSVVALTVVSSAVCWIIRTNCLKHIDASTVAVITPFSAVITSIVSIIVGTDTMSLNIVLGGGLGMLAIILTAFDK